jgi:glucose-1-phosphate adenylyltransferase
MLFDKLQAVVLGLGLEKHLYPLTRLRSKPAVPVGGQFRLIDISISNCLNSGITRIFVLTQCLSASLHRHLSCTYQFSAFSGSSVEILATDETLNGACWCQGTADAVRRQMSRILSRETEHVLVLSGDHLCRMDLSELAHFHYERQADVTLSALPVPAEGELHYNTVESNAEGRIVTFRPNAQSEKVLDDPKSHPGENRPRLVPMGVYLFRTETLAYLLAQNNGSDFAQHILPAAIKSQRTYVYPHKGYWEDLSSISAFYRAHLAMAHPDPPFDLGDPRWTIYTRSRFVPPSRIDGCRLERAIVADGCQLYGADIEECVIGLRSIVRPGARLRQVVTMGADFYESNEQKAENRRRGRPDIGIGHDAFIERAIIDRNVRIGQRVFIGSHVGEENRDEALYAVRDGIVVIPENTVIPDGTVIDVRPPDWIGRPGQRHVVERQMALAGLVQ